MREVLIDRDEDIEFFFTERQQFAVLDAFPSHVLDGFDVMPGDFPGKPAVNAFVEKNPQFRTGRVSVSDAPSADVTDIGRPVLSTWLPRGTR